MKREKFLQKLSNLVSNISPGISRYLLLKSQEELSDKNQKLDLADHPSWPFSSCPYCGQKFDVLNHHVRVKPRQKLDKKLWKLMKKEQSDPALLGKYQRHCLQRFKESRNNVVVTCHTCSKTTQYPCQKWRDRIKDTIRTVASQKQIAGDTAEIVSKTRKEKRKEKKKLLKRKKQEAAVKEISSTPSGNTSLLGPTKEDETTFVNRRSSIVPDEKVPKDISANPVIKKTSSNISGEMKTVSPVSENTTVTDTTEGIPEISAPQVFNASRGAISGKKISKVTSEDLNTKQFNVSKHDGTSSKFMHSQSVQNKKSAKLKMGLQTDSKVIKKKKSKDKHKMLSKMLSQDKKEDNSTLSAFLSTL